MAHMLVGREYKNWKVLSQAPSRKGRRCWNCKCTLCGKVVSVSGNNLINGRSGSCGCSKKRKKAERLSTLVLITPIENTNGDKRRKMKPDGPVADSKSDGA